MLRILIPVLILSLALLRATGEGTLWSSVAQAGIRILMAAELILSLMREYSPDQGPVRQGRAEILSKRVDAWRVKFGNGIFYAAVFRLGNSQLEPLPTAGEFRTLAEGSKGLLI